MLPVLSGPFLAECFLQQPRFQIQVRFRVLLFLRNLQNFPPPSFSQEQQAEGVV